MTNPFYDAPTGNPFYDSPSKTIPVSPEEEQPQDEAVYKTLVRSTIGGFYSPAKNVSNWLATKSSSFSGISNYLNEELAKIDPKDTPNPIARKIGHFIGESIPVLGAYGAVEKGVTKLIGKRVLTNIANVATNITGKQFLGNVAAGLPASIAGGVASTGVMNPEDLSTTGGWALASGFGAVGAILPSARLKALVEGRDAQNLPRYTKEILDRIGVPETESAINQTRLYDNLFDQKAPIGRLVKASGMDFKGIEHKNPADVAYLASGSGGRRERALKGNGTFILDDKTGEMIETGGSLRKAWTNLETKADVLRFKALTLAKNVLDPAMELQVIKRKEALETVLAASDQNLVSVLTKNYDEIIKDEAKNVLKFGGQGMRGTTFNPKQAWDTWNVIKKNKNFSVENVTGIKKSNAILEEANAPAHIQAAVAETSIWRGNILKYARSKGMLSEKTETLWRKLGENHVSFERIFEGKPINEPVTQLGKAAQFLGSKLPASFKERFGSTKLIKDPITSTIEESKLIEYADKNWVAANLHEMVKVDAALPPAQRKLGDLVSMLPDGNIANDAQILGVKENIMAAAKAVGLNVNEAEALELAAQMGSRKLDTASNVLNFYDDGVMRRMKLSPDLAKAFEVFQPQDMNLFVKLMGYPARGLRNGVTLMGDFTFYNAVADTYTATLQSKHGFKLGIDTYKGLVEAVKDTQLARNLGSGGSAVRQEYLAGGGGMGGLRTADKGLTTSQAMRSLVPAERSKITTYLHPIDVLTAIAKPIEEATRIGEYMLARKAGLSMTAGSLAGRNISTDFAKVGASMKPWAHMTAFLNPGLQSLERNFEAVKNHPIKLAIKGVAAISMPTATLYAINYGDKDIEDLRKSPAGSIYWHFRLPNDDIGRIRKPFAYGQVFANGMESALDKLLEDDPRAFKTWVDGVRGQLGIAMIPNAAAQVAEVWANKDFHTGAPIIPTEQTGIDNHYQSTPTTSALSKTIHNVLYEGSGGAINISPIQMDYVIRSSLGPAGENVAKQTSKLIPSENHGPEPTKGDLPYIGRFFARFPTQSVEPVRTFYDNLAESEGVIKTAAKLERSQPNKLAGYINDNARAYALAPILTETKMQLADIRHEMQIVNDAPDDVISPKEKRTYVDMYVRQIITITGAVNRGIEEKERNPLIKLK